MILRALLRSESEARCWRLELVGAELLIDPGTTPFEKRAGESSLGAHGGGCRLLSRRANCTRLNLTLELVGASDLVLAGGLGSGRLFRPLGSARRGLFRSRLSRHTRASCDVRRPDSGDQIMWRCPKCGENMEDTFGACWKCGAAPAGNSNPDDDPHRPTTRDIVPGPGSNRRSTWPPARWRPW